MKKTIAVMFGGKSVEHDISVLTAVEAMAHLDEESYRVYPVYMSKSGVWYTGEKWRSLQSYIQPEQPEKSLRCTFLPDSHALWALKKNKCVKITEIDAVLLCNHGAYGEDGCLQGFLELCDLAYTSCGVLASAAGMDKHCMKTLFSALQLPVVQHVLMKRGSPEDFSGVTYPAVVKPASLGSSIGISFVKNDEELRAALEVAFVYDEKALVERALQNFREINCAAVWDGKQLFVSECEEPKTDNSFLSFSDKYLNGGKVSGQAHAEREFPAKISPERKAEIQDTVRRIYEGFGAKGVIRVDFMLEDETLYVNEVNTIPGALSNYLFPFSYEVLLDKLIAGAIKSSRQRGELTRKFDSSIMTTLKDGQNTCLKSDFLVK